MVDSNEKKKNNAREDENLTENISKIKKTILVLSGKGGVGKSTVSVNLALSLANAGKKVGLLDIDIHGPSIPILLGMKHNHPEATPEQKIIPLNYRDTLKVMSIGFLIHEDKDAVIWRGPLKHGVIRQFLSDVLWGELDYLIVDSPPGTGDEPLSIAQFMKDSASAVLVTTPQEVSVIDVKRSITFCEQVGVPVMGVVENMSGFICEHCGKETAIFNSGGGKKMATEMSVPFLGTIPLDPEIVKTTDSGEPYVLKFQNSKTAESFAKITKPILKSAK